MDDNTAYILFVLIVVGYFAVCRIAEAIEARGRKGD